MKHNKLAVILIYTLFFVVQRAWTDDAEPGQVPGEVTILFDRNNLPVKQCRGSSTPTDCCEVGGGAAVRYTRR